jgi:hypothetical protein
MLRCETEMSCNAWPAASVASQLKGLGDGASSPRARNLGHDLLGAAHIH